MKAPSDLERDVPLAPRTTLELGGAAEYFLEARSIEALRAAMAWAAHEELPVTLLGGGSNAIVPDAGVRGLVIGLETRGIEVSQAGKKVRVTVAAGEGWDPLVTRAVDEGWAGVECLAGIPGKVGATPIQNVGAYGQEVSQTVVSVGCLDRATGETVERSARDCAFGYRDSGFKRNPGRYLVTEVSFELIPGGAPMLAYRELVDRAPSAPSLEEVRALVVELRRRKSMVLDPNDPNRRSAGSFFTNPIVSAERVQAVEAEAARRELGAVPQWATASGTKLAAGWLIERAGFPKGRRQGAIGQSSQHALALVHHGGGTTAELLAYADEVVAGVRSVFGITLEREPRLLGTD